jgi:hypothetical protein
MFHLSIRVAWHDNRWNGPVCQSSTGNPLCASLERIREEMNPEAKKRFRQPSHDSHGRHL